MSLSVEKVRDALVLALAVDGYIDIEGQDGEADLYGDADQYVMDNIDSAARSLHRFLVMNAREIKAVRTEVLTRRKQEGRE